MNNEKQFLKVLIINDVCGHLGGTEAMVLQLKEQLILKGHTVKLMTGNDGLSKFKPDEFTFKSFKNKSFIRFILYIYNPHSAKIIVNALREFQPDIVHVHNMSKASASILLKLKHTPTIMTAHDIECIDPTNYKNITSIHPFKKYYKDYFIFSRDLRFYVQKVRYLILRYAQKNIDLIIAPSNAMATLLNEGGLPAPIKTIYNGITNIDYGKNLTYSIAPSTIMYVGRIEIDKGVNILTSAMKIVISVIPNAKLLVIGKGTEISTMKNYASTNLRNSVKFYGEIKHDHLNHFYRKADIVVVPSICYESLGLVAMEAMMAGKPVIASAAGGLVELVDNGITGVLFEPGNIIQLADCIIKLLSEPKKLETMGRAGLKKSAVFSATNYIDQTISTYRTVISKYHS